MAAADTIKEISIEVKRCADCGARFGIDAAFCPFDGVPLSTSTWDKAGDPRAHLRVDDRYEVLEPLGEGGMGTVYKVRHVTLDRLFAMKVLRRDLATDTDLAQRFVQEAKATAAIKHPSVVAITDFGDMEDGIPYFVMELLEGETLATRIRARGPIPPATALAIAKQIADGLVASHAAKVIHRDLKPDNVFLIGKRAAEEEIRIVDFGAAKIIGGSKLTRPGIVFGTPYYMSPEQASGQPIDGRADVYSLGVLLYEMITGRVPFEADTYMGVLTKHLFQAPPRLIAPSGVQLGDVEPIVMRALEKDPAARYDSMSAFARTLEEVLEGAASGRIVKPERSAERAPAPTMKMGTMTTADRIQLSVSRRIAAEARRKRLVAIGALSASATLLGGAALVAYVTSGPTASPEVPTPAAPPPAATAADLGPAASGRAPDEQDEPAPAAAVAIIPVESAPETGAEARPHVPPESRPETRPAAATEPASSNATRRPPPVAPPRAEASSAPAPAKPRPSSVPAAPPPPAPRADDFPDPWKR